MNGMQKLKSGAVLAALLLSAGAFLAHPIIVRAQSDGSTNSVDGDDGDYDGDMPPMHHCGRPPGPPPSPEEMIASQLDGLSSDQESQIDALFKAEHDEMAALHKKTCQKLESLLTADQLKQFKRSGPPPCFGPPPPFGPPPGESSGEAPSDDDLLEEAIDQYIIGS